MLFLHKVSFLIVVIIALCIIVTKMGIGLKHNKQHNIHLNILNFKQSRRTRFTRNQTIYPTYGRTFVLNNPNLCGKMEDVSLLFVVHSATHHFQQRHNIRSTFANQSYFTRYTVRVVFLVGRHEDEHIENEIASENRVCGDVVQGDFMDSYRNLTLKVVSALYWVTQYCSRVSVVAKIDDDTFVDTVKVLKVLIPFLNDHRSTLLCPQSGHSFIEREGKWSVPKYVMRHYKKYQWIRCSGFGVFMSGDMIGWLYKAATFSPFLWVDDVYFSGLLPSRLRQVEHRGISSTLKTRTENTLCLLRENCTSFISIVDSPKMPSLWTSVIHRYYKKYSL